MLKYREKGGLLCNDGENNPSRLIFCVSFVDMIEKETLVLPLKDSGINTLDSYHDLAP